MHAANIINYIMYMYFRPAVFILKEQERGGVLSASAPEISACIAPFGPVGPYIIP